MEQGDLKLSVRVEAERRRARRAAHNRDRFGRLGGFKTLVEREPQSERNWRVGAEAEEKAGARLEKLLAKHGIIVLHDRRIPGGRANIDHVAIGPGGVTVIDSKSYKGKVRVRGGKLWVGGRDRTKLVDGALDQASIVRSLLIEHGRIEAEVAAMLCWSNTEALPALGKPELRGVAIAGPRAVARRARRRGALSPEATRYLGLLIEEHLPAY